MNTQQINGLLNFSPEILAAFYKMVKGTSLNLSDEGKKEIKGNTGATGRWWFIVAINSDESINICSDTHSIFENAKISWLKL